MRVRVPDDCIVVPRASLRALHDERDDLRKQLQQALERIAALERRSEEAKASHEFDQAMIGVLLRPNGRNEVLSILMAESERRIAGQPKPPPDLFAPCYSPPGWRDPDTDPDAK